MPLKPKQIVEALDDYIIGQDHAKRMVAIALRNRYRRRRLTPEKAEEIMPKNILLIGPTGVGKTEIARRLAGLAAAPFVKVEATKYTEVGYVGRDVESMVRDLVDTAFNLVRAERSEELRTQAEANAEERLLDLLLPSARGGHRRTSSVFPNAPQEVSGPGFVMRTPERQPPPGAREAPAETQGSWERSREKLREQLRAGELDERTVEMEISVSPALGIMGGGPEEMGVDMQGMLERMLPRQTHRRSMKVAEARDHLVEESVEEMLDKEAIAREALTRAAEDGIIFIDEIDKIAGRRGQDSRGGPDVSREGVQRDILPIVEGSTVKTKYGLVKTDHVLFVAAGAFSHTSPADLIPELQGRFPLRSELRPLTAEDFERILTEPRTSLTRQYQDLLATDGVELEFAGDGVSEIARAAFDVNSRTENIGARRLHTLLERILEEVAYGAPDDVGGRVVVDAAYVRARLKDLWEDQDLQRFIL